MTALPQELTEALAAFADLPQLLIATDYDGVVAPIVSDPAQAFPLPGTISALTALAELPSVTVALVSGRDRATLQRLSGVREPVITVGSHGAEWDSDFEAGLNPAAQQLRRMVLAQLEQISERFPGSAVEPKPLGAALHVRNVENTEEAHQALALARSGPAALAGVHATEGKSVLELAVADTSKGNAINTIRDRVSADGVLYLGDDVTDEKAFAVLTAPSDVPVKVGDGETKARYRVAEPADARAVFEGLLARRGAPSR